jgi:hypothetical protein
MGLVRCGVPQGSLLGPLLFIIYINDVCDILHFSTPYIYADDTALFCTGDQINEVIGLLNEDLDKISKWMKINKLTLNVKKTKWVLFTTAQRRKTLNIINTIAMDGEMIDTSNSVKYLGLILDEFLTMADHTKYILNKLNKFKGILARARHYLTTKTLVAIYKGLIQPHLIYGIEIWGITSRIHYINLSILQKKLIRIICHLQFHEHTQPWFEYLEILSLDKLIAFHVGVTLYKIIKNGMPGINCNFACPTHKYNTRFSSHGLFSIPINKLKIGQLCFESRAVSIWNMIPIEIRSAITLIKYKKLLLKWVQTNYFVDRPSFF